MALARPLGIAQTLVVEASPWLEDNEWLLGLAVQNPEVLGCVGNLSEATDPAQLETALGTFAKNPRFRGVRLNAGELQATSLDFLSSLADRGLTLDLLAWPEDLPRISEVASKVRKLRIVIDHLANVTVDGTGPRSSWTQALQALAAQPNVFCKVSGLVEGTGRKDATAPTSPAFYVPTLDVAYDAFGADRLLFASNWPVSSLYAALGTVVGIATTYFGDKGRLVRDKVLGGNARAVYGL